MAAGNKPTESLEQFINTRESKELKAAYNYYNELKNELEKYIKIAGDAENNSSEEITDLKSKIAELEKENKELKQENEKLKNSNSEIEKQKDQVKEQVDDYIEELENIRRHYATISNKDK